MYEILFFISVVGLLIFLFLVCLENIDSAEVEGYAIFDSESGSTVTLPYPMTNGILPRGRSFHHGSFVGKLREAVQTVST